MRPGWNLLSDALASLKLAVVVMSALALACIVATFYEAQHGTAAAQRAFYRSAWFTFLLALLAVNVLWSVVKRYPWSRHHTGFLLAHAGILLILGGSVYSLHGGLDGRMALLEGDTGQRIGLARESLRVTLPGGAEAEVPVAFQDRAPLTGQRLPLPGTGAWLVVEEFRPHVRISDTLAEAEDEAAPPRPALHFTLATPFLSEDGWLIPADPDHRQASFGPVVFSVHPVAQPGDSPLPPPATGNGLAFLLMADGSLRYSLTAAKSPPAKGVAELGQPILTPWMNMTVTVDRLLRRAAMRRVVIRAPMPAREEDRRPAVRLRLEGAGSSEPEWLAWGESRPVRAGSGRAQLAWVPAEAALPFRVTLLQFKSEKYPGSAMPATYESLVRVDDPQMGTSEHRISMNNPLHHRGYVFFQSSFAEGPRMTSVFSVVRAPGLPVVYLGTALLSLGVLWMFYVKPRLARWQGRQALRARYPGLQPGGMMRTLLCLALASTAASAVAETDLSPVRSLAIQDGGRSKPLDTFGRETARRVSGARAFTGGERVAGQDPAEWVISLVADPRRWEAEPMFRVTHAALRERISLPAAQDRFSFQELAGHTPFLEAVGEVQERMRVDPDARLDPVEQEVVTLHGTLSLVAGIFSGEALRIVPDPAADDGSWLTVADLGNGEGPAVVRLRERVGDLALASRRGDREALAVAARALSKELRDLSPSSYPPAATLEREVRYNRLKPFRLSWLLYLAGFLTLLVGLAVRTRLATRVGIALVCAGFALTTYGMVLRTLVAGRAPVTNMYETVVFAAWGAVLLALLFELRSSARVATACASGLAVVALILADNVPIMDGSITPLVPVLRDNTWLTLHVLTITLGYAAFLLALGLGHVTLGLMLFAPRRAALAKSLSQLLYRSLQVGTLFLAIGTLLGGVWASYSWGRFWGWDPKETWALIALLGYLALLHGRLLGWIRDFGLAVGSILGFLLVLMAWYGVNFVLGTGLHSYGFGAGGYGYVGAYLALEGAFLGYALWRGGPSPRPAITPAAPRLA